MPVDEERDEAKQMQILGRDDLSVSPNESRLGCLGTGREGFLVGAHGVFSAALGFIQRAVRAEYKLVLVFGIFRE